MKKLLFISVLVSFFIVLGNLSYAQNDVTHSNSISTLTPEEIQQNIDEYVPHVGRSNLNIPSNWCTPNTEKSLLDSRGTDFWLLFMDNLNLPTPYLDIASTVNATGTVSISEINFSETFSVMANTVIRVNLPAGAEITTSGTIQSLGIHVVSDYEVTVYGMNRAEYSTDGFLGLPVDILGTNYLAMTYSGFIPEFALVSPYDNNQVSITPIIGDPININLNQGETYMLAGDADMTGSVIISTLPIAFFSGNDCANVPVGYTYCDHLVEQIPPVSTWGTSFVTKTLSGRLNGDTWRFLASQNGTQVMINGAAAGPVLNFGDFYETILTENSFVGANYPILAVQFSNGQTWDGVEADPFMMVIPPYQQFLDCYSFSTPVSGFTTNYFNSAVETTGVSDMMLDGNPLSTDAYIPIATTDFSAAEFPIEINSSHNISNSGDYSSGLYLYGFGSYDSYGYPGGLSLITINVGSGPMIELTTATVDYFCTELSSGVLLEISATITDPEEPFVQSATLFYRNIGSAEYTSMVMTMSTDDVWSASIPAVDINYPGMEYYIYATDGQVGETSPNSDPANNPYSVGIDNEPPQIVHTPVTHGTIGTSIFISADVTDITNSVQSVELFYRIEGGTPVYTILDMSNTDGDTYSATIPGIQMTEQGINYFIKATDDLGVSCTYGFSDEPIYVGYGFSIDELEAEIVSLYPNPAKDFIQFESEFAITKIEIFDQFGRLLLNKKVNNKSAKLNISNLNSGIYLIQVSTKERKLAKKLIIN